MTIGAVIAVAGYVAGTTSLFGLIGAVAMSVISHSSQAKARKQQQRLDEQARQAADAAKGFQVAVEGGVQTIGVAYGRCKVAGVRTMHGTCHQIVAGTMSPNTIVFPSTGTRNSGPVLAASAPAVHVRVNLYQLLDAYGRPDTYPDGHPKYTGLDPTPWVYSSFYNQALNPRLEENAAFRRAPTDSVEYTIATPIFYGGSGTGYYTYIPAGEERNIPISSSVVIQHPSFFKNRDGSLQDVEESFSYNVVGYDNATGQLFLTGLDLTSAAVPGRSLITFEQGKSGVNANEALFFRQAICYKGINNVLYCEIDGQPYNTQSLESRIHVLCDGGTAEAWVVRHFPDEANSLMSASANATVMCWLNRDSPQYYGVPDVAFHVEGMKVGTIHWSYGVAGYISTGTAYNNNPACCLLDYLLNAEYGKGLTPDEIDFQSFYIAQEICNRVVRVNNQEEVPPEGGFWREQALLGVPRILKLYECNLVIDTGLSVRENIEILLSTMGEADLVWSGGKYRLVLTHLVEWSPTFANTSLGNLFYSSPSYAVRNGAESFYIPGDYIIYPAIDDPSASIYTPLTKVTTANPPILAGSFDNTRWARAEAIPFISTNQGLLAATITDADIVLGAEASQSWTAAQDRLNFFTVHFLNEALDFKSDSVSWPGKYSNILYSTFFAEDGNVPLEGEAFAQGVVSSYQAQAQAESIVRASRNNATYQFSLMREFLYLEPGDVVKLSSETLGTLGELLRITSVAVNSNQEIEIKAVRYDPKNALWGSDVYEYVPDRTYYEDIIAQAGDLVFTEATSYGTVGSGLVSWTAAADSRIVGYDIKFTYELPATVSLSTEWIDLGTTSGLSFNLPIIQGSSGTIAVVAKTRSGSLADEMNPRTGSRWPLLYIDPLDVTSPVVCEVAPSTLVLAPLDVSGFPDYASAVAAVRVWKGDIDLAKEVGAPVTITPTGENCTVLMSAVPEERGNFTISNITARVGKITFAITVDGAAFSTVMGFSYSGEFLNTSTVGTATPPPPSFTLEAIGSTLQITHPAPLATFLVSGAPGETRTINGGYDRTLVYSAIKAGVTPVFGDAVIMGTSTTNDATLTATPLSEYYVWLTWVSKSGAESAPTGPMIVTTPSVTAALTGAITTAELETSLAADINIAIALIGRYGVKVDSDGFVTGYGELTTANDATPTASWTFHPDAIRMDHLSAVGPVAPFIYQSTPAFINGASVESPAGLYLNDALIRNGAITDDMLATPPAAGGGTVFIRDVYAGGFPFGGVPVAGYMGADLRDVNWPTIPTMVTADITFVFDDTGFTITSGDMALELFQGGSTTPVAAQKVLPGKYSATIRLSYVPAGPPPVITQLRVAMRFPASYTGWPVFNNIVVLYSINS